uniref:Uncharacterized protein n=1 Tax=Cannabis sativa TaxID=3483 RepID=A0A803PQ13_CANSA
MNSKFQQTFTIWSGVEEGKRKRAVPLGAAKGLVAKRKKVALKLVSVAASAVKEKIELPLIQEEDASAHMKVFLDLCDELETGLKEAEDGPNSVKLTLRSASWADEME